MDSPCQGFCGLATGKTEAHTLEWLAEYLDPYLAMLPSGYAHFLGEDFGRSGDLTVLWPATEKPDTSLVTPFVLELRDCPHRTQEQILFHIIQRLPRFSGAALDARGNGSALAESARQAFGTELIAEVMISEKWYRETMPKMKARLEDKTLTIPQSADIRADLRCLRVVKGIARVPDKRQSDSTGKRHGDAAIALAMLIHAHAEMGSVEPWDCVTENRSEATGDGFDFGGW